MSKSHHIRREGLEIATINQKRRRTYTIGFYENLRVQTNNMSNATNRYIHSEKGERCTTYTIVELSYNRVDQFDI